MRIPNALFILDVRTSGRIEAENFGIKNAGAKPTTSMVKRGMDNQMLTNEDPITCLDNLTVALKKLSFTVKVLKKDQIHTLQISNLKCPIQK
jgi:hypothetical protein